DPLFSVCWSRQSCGSCLAGDFACSWCPFSSTCVPNRARLAIFAPLSSSQVCPLGSQERWELRALPLGCHVSTITVMTVLGTVCFILASLGLAVLSVW
ncbi:hypothetical protein ASPZODRAFT_47209, partial [Penicilliopsis zonata CBS 506.65]